MPDQYDAELPAVLLLDTSHLSDLAYGPTTPASAEVLRRLQRGDATLAVSLFQILEFAHPGFEHVGDIRALLADVPHVLANPFEDVVDEEMALVCARVTGKRRRAPRVWAHDTSEWGYHIGPIGGSAVDMLDAFRQTQVERAQIHAMAEYGAAGSMMKDRAALVQSPELPLTLALQRHIDLQRLRHPPYAAGLSGADVLARAGGPVAFPAYHTQEALVAQRMRDPGQKSTPNDVYDEFIACYAPYAAVTAVDRRTLHRARMARLDAVPRMTRHLADVPGLLDRALAGELVPVESAY
jgi:hypothetical protein